MLFRAVAIHALEEIRGVWTGITVDAKEVGPGVLLTISDAADDLLLDVAARRLYKAD